MEIMKEINKSLIINLLILIVLSLAIYYFYGYVNAGFKWVIPEKYATIVEYVLCGISIMQLVAVYNIIEKAIFNSKTLSKLAKTFEATGDKLLEKFSPEEVAIIKTTKLIFDQNFAFIVYGLVLAFLGSDKITFAGFFLLAILVLCVTWLRINHKVKKYFAAEKT